MLYKFKSKVTGDLILLEPAGRRVLTIIGKAITAQGILLPEQMAAARSALHAAIEADEAAQREAIAQALAEGQEPPRFEGITLRQRAMPFIEMMQRCEAAGVELVWGV